MHTLDILMIGGFTPWYPKAGGGQIFAYELAKALTELGCNVDFVAVAPRVLQYKRSDINLLYVDEESPRIKFLKFIKDREFRISHYDIVHIHEGNETVGYGFGMYIKTLLRKSNVDFFMNVHAPDVHRIPRSIQEAFWQKISKKANGVFVPSKFSADNLSKNWGISRMKIMPVYGGVQEKFFKISRSIDKFRYYQKGLLFVGRLSGVQKGLDILIKALPLILKDHNDIILNVIGSGPKEKYEALARSLKVDKYINFLGFVNEQELINHYTQSDLFVLPSRRESFGLVLAEVMAVGLPVVSTKVGAIPEVVEDGRTGILVPPNDPRSLAEAVNYLLDHPAKRKSMGVKGRKLVKKEFTWTKVAKRVIQGYDQFCQ